MKKFTGMLFTAMFAMASAQAQVVTFDFTAKVHGLDTSGGKVIGPGFDIAAGDTVHGRFSFDVATPLSTLVDWTPAYKSRLYEGPQHPVLAAFTVDRNGQTSAIGHPSASSILVENAPVSLGGDSLKFQTSIHAPDWSQGSWVALTFNDRTGTALDSMSIPGSFSLSAFHSASFIFGWSDNTKNTHLNTGGYGTITSLTQVVTSPVPEPTTYAMFAVGLVAVGAMARRKAAPQT
ncbi:PEP-CTERM sorting domain-containing protein [Massilia atriviolacea]|uniref:PEP-CTERM sorting domain-containing protein n=1 Tax=Massilia atriviolacea TaxID=2495579 RepID=A0A430HIR6_9BURK|nr:PEP-CTERM sorting domain-containing protein [Massilia atriviolacea]RSZ57426.1 PEP-CTERM sorting domain-containing protein [Massilia atriviolacea]